MAASMVSFSPAMSIAPFCPNCESAATTVLLNSAISWACLRFLGEAVGLTRGAIAAAAAAAAVDVCGGSTADGGGVCDCAGVTPSGDDTAEPAGDCAGDVFTDDGGGGVFGAGECPAADIAK